MLLSWYITCEPHLLDVLHSFTTLSSIQHTWNVAIITEELHVIDVLLIGDTEFAYI
jgi:hypothetical protein